MQTILLGLSSEIRICRKVGFQKRFTLVIIAAIELYDSPPIYSDEFRLPNSLKDLLLILSSAVYVLATENGRYRSNCAI